MRNQDNLLSTHPVPVPAAPLPTATGPVPIMMAACSFGRDTYKNIQGTCSLRSSTWILERDCCLYCYLFSPVQFGSHQPNDVIILVHMHIFSRHLKLHPDKNCLWPEMFL